MSTYDRGLFLDIDGVLNSESYFESNLETVQESGHTTSPEAYINPASVDHLNELLWTYRCRVVLSSSWRHYYDLKRINEVLQQNGFQHKVHDAIPGTASSYSIDWGSRTTATCRGENIENYLLERSGSTWSSIVILDDKPSDELSPFDEFHVRTDPERGLQKEDLDEAKTVLRTEEMTLKDG